MRNWMICAAIAAVFLVVSEKAMCAEISDNSKVCISCHENVTPGIYHDWLRSGHAAISPEEALKKPKLEKMVNGSVPEAFLKNAVGCFECHSLNKDKHTDNFSHFGFDINIVVSPNDCKVCHEEEVSQYVKSKKGQAVFNIRDNPVYSALVNSIISTKDAKDGKVIPGETAHLIGGDACYACHGTKVEVTGMKEVDTEFGSVEVPILSNWPNQGVGRLNPDGSSGACTSCHPRHSFSIEIARKPYTCAECHLDPDVPAWNVYRESKHGNIFLSEEESWNWKSVPWKPGKDFKSPTCATCHASLLVKDNGDVIAERTHDFGSRLWVRLFGLIYSAPQPKEGNTNSIVNKDGLPLPTSFVNEPAYEYLIDAEEQAKRKNVMTQVCRSCHSTQWVEGHFAQLDATIEETNKMTLAATKLMVYGWEHGAADKTNPFDERTEQLWIQQWLFYANSTRYGSAMGGQDYSAFKNGWWYLTQNLKKLEEEVNESH